MIYVCYSLFKKSLPTEGYKTNLCFLNKDLSLFCTFMSLSYIFVQGEGLGILWTSSQPSSTYEQFPPQSTSLSYHIPKFPCNMWVCFWALSSTLLVYLSFLTPVPHSLIIYRFLVTLIFGITAPCSFSKLSILRPFLSLYTQNFWELELH